MGPILEALFLKSIELILENAVKHTIDYLKRNKSGYKLDKDSFIKSINSNITRTSSWSQNIAFQGITEDKLTEDIYIDLDFYLTPLRYTANTAPQKEKLVEEVFNQTDNHIILQGGPGTGKTTSMKMIAIKLLKEEEYLPDLSFPIVIRLREANNDLLSLTQETLILPKKDERETEIIKIYQNDILFMFLYKELGLGYQKDGKSIDLDDIKSGFIRKYIIDVLEYLSPLIILDGYDELSINIREQVFREINYLCLSLKKARVLLTTRTGDFDYEIDNARKFQIAPLDDEKIMEFCQKWLKDSKKSDEFFSKIKDSPLYDATIRPINLAFLATLYETSGTLPSKPKSIYKEIINLLLEKWDKVRGIHRLSAMSNFESSTKFDYLMHLAFHLAKDEATVFSKQRLEGIYKRLSSQFGLPEDGGPDVVNELETHSGLFIQSGYDYFEFPHKSIQEYLASEYISKYSPVDDLKDILLRLPNEFAIATGLSTNPKYYFLKAIEFYTQNDNFDSLKTYFDRIIQEQVDFSPSEEIAYKILLLWNGYLANEEATSSILAELYNLNTIRISFKRLESLYRVSSDIYLKSWLGKKSELKKNLNKVTDIHLRRVLKNSEHKEDLKCPILFLQDWKYIKTKDQK